MGMFSWCCKGCGHELVAGESVRIFGRNEIYDGYGGSARGEFEPPVWHQSCYSQATDKQKLDDSPSRHAPNQGFGFPKLEYMHGFDKNAVTIFSVSTTFYEEMENNEYRDYHLFYTTSEKLEDQYTAEKLLYSSDDDSEMSEKDLPSSRIKKFNSMEEAIKALELILDQYLPKGHRNLYIYVFGRQGKIEGLVYEKTFDQNNDPICNYILNV